MLAIGHVATGDIHAMDLYILDRANNGFSSLII